MDSFTIIQIDIGQQLDANICRRLSGRERDIPDLWKVVQAGLCFRAPHLERNGERQRVRMIQLHFGYELLSLVETGSKRLK